MARLIIEIPGRHGHRYYPVDQPVLRIGRAYDNDLILSDPSVSPYHLLLRRDAEGHYQIDPLAEENGIRIGRRIIRDAITLTDLPLELEAGHTRLRIRDRNQPVAPTRMLSCRNGAACIFGNWGWALFLFVLLGVLSAVDNYWSTPQTLSWESWGSDQLILILGALGLSLGLLGLNRITSPRWNYPAALAFVSLMLIAAFLLELLIPFADYYFTSPLPGFLIGSAWSLLLLPLALAWFLIRLNHGNPGLSILFIVLLLTPGAYVQITEITEYYDLFGAFSSKAHYSDALYPWDLRLQPTLSIEDFAHSNARLPGSGDTVP